METFSVAIQHCCKNPEGLKVCLIPLILQYPARLTAAHPRLPNAHTTQTPEPRFLTNLTQIDYKLLASQMSHKFSSEKSASNAWSRIWKKIQEGGANGGAGGNGVGSPKCSPDKVAKTSRRAGGKNKKKEVGDDEEYDSVASGKKGKNSAGKEKAGKVKKEVESKVKQEQTEDEEDGTGMEEEEEGKGKRSEAGTAVEEVGIEDEELVGV